MRTSVGPGLAPNGCLAPSAGLIGLAVGKEFLGEVPSLTVDVLVLLVEARATLLGRLG